MAAMTWYPRCVVPSRYRLCPNTFCANRERTMKGANGDCYATKYPVLAQSRERANIVAKIKRDRVKNQDNGLLLPAMLPSH